MFSDSDNPESKHSEESTESMLGECLNEKKVRFEEWGSADGALNTGIKRWMS